MSAAHLGKKRKKQEIETSSKPVILAFLYFLLSEFAFMLTIIYNIQNNILTRDLKKNIGCFISYLHVRRSCFSCVWMGSFHEEEGGWVCSVSWPPCAWPVRMCHWRSETSRLSSCTSWQTEGKGSSLWPVPRKPRPADSRSEMMLRSGFVQLWTHTTQTLSKVASYPWQKYVQPLAQCSLGHSFACPLACCK